MLWEGVILVAARHAADMEATVTALPFNRTLTSTFAIVIVAYWLTIWRPPIHAPEVGWHVSTLLLGLAVITSLITSRCLLALL